MASDRPGTAQDDIDPFVPPSPADPGAEQRALALLAGASAAPNLAAAAPASGVFGRLGAEVLGVFWIVLAGGTATIFTGTQTGGSLPLALTYGLAVAVAAFGLVAVSGAHFNPAVTLGAAISGRIAWREVLPYVLAQLIGGTLGAAVVFLLVATYPDIDDARPILKSATSGYGTAATSLNFGLVSVLVIETLAVALLVGLVLAASRSLARLTVPFAAGLGYAVVFLFTFPVTNGSGNFAKAFGFSLFAERTALEQLWVFLVATVVGGAVAGLVARAFGPSTRAAVEEPFEDDFDDEDDAEDIEAASATGPTA